MDDHFAELFASYEQLVRDNRSKPGPRRAA